WLKPDGKTQVTVSNSKGVITALTSTQHAEEVSQEEIRETARSSYRARELDCSTPVGCRDNEMRKIESRVCDVPQLNPLVAGRCVGARPRYFIYDNLRKCFRRNHSDQYQSQKNQHLHSQSIPHLILNRV
ncbi:MAG: hypothetical protein UY74_C0080G0008, partial [Candidatus Kaiserbacteria bacterium GW2011_GWC2_52_8b]